MLSVLSPMGLAALGYRQGDELECETPGGKRRLRIVKVLFQPEANAKTAA
jgi:regulator of nucleoside diphosphate kinase